MRLASGRLSACAAAADAENVGIDVVTHSAAKEEATIHSPHSTQDGWVRPKKFTQGTMINLTMLMTAPVRHTTPATAARQASGTADRGLNGVRAQYNSASRAMAEATPRINLAAPSSEIRGRWR